MVNAVGDQLQALNLNTSIRDLALDAVRGGASERSMSLIPGMMPLLLVIRDQREVDPEITSAATIIQYIRGLKEDEWAHIAEEVATLLRAVTDVSGQSDPVENIPFAFDTETTGLNINSCHILDICVQDLSSGSEFDTLVNPGDSVTISRRITDLTGISRQTLTESSAPPERVVALALCVWLLQRCLLYFMESKRSKRKRLLLIAHNAQFDARILAAMFLRCGPCLSLDRFFTNWIFLCTYSLARTCLKRDAHPDLGDYKLLSLGQFFKIEWPSEGQAHRAKYDVLVLVAILPPLIALAPGEDAGLPFLDKLKRWQHKLKTGQRYIMSESIQKCVVDRVQRPCPQDLT